MFAEKKQDVTTDVIRRALKRTPLKTTITMKKVLRFDGAVETAEVSFVSIQYPSQWHIPASV